MVQDFTSWNGRNSQETSSSIKRKFQREEKLWAKVWEKTIRNEIVMKIKLLIYLCETTCCLIKFFVVVKVDPIICHQLLDTNQVPLSEELEKFKEKTLEECLMDIAVKTIQSINKHLKIIY